MQEIDVPDFKLITIARRRWKMGGARYHARGVNDDGDVSNYTEMEQLIIKHTRYQNQ